MRNSHNRVLVAVVSTVLVWCCGAQAQSPPPSPESGGQRVVSLKFPGGTLADYVETLRDAVGTLNIVLSGPEVGAVRLPPIELESVLLHSAMAVLEGEVWLNNSAHLRVSVEQLGFSTDENVKPVFRVTAHRRGGPASPDVHVWSVAGLLAQGVESAGVLTAVETAIDLLEGSYQAAEVRFHEATGLLIASGQDQQLEAIDRVVDGLHRSVDERREATREQDALERVEELEALTQKQAKELKSLRGYLDISHRRVDEVRRENAELRDEISRLKPAGREAENHG